MPPILPPEVSQYIENIPEKQRPGFDLVFNKILTAMPELTVAKEMGLIVSLCAGVGWIWWENKFNGQRIGRILGSKSIIKMVYMVFAILIFKEILQDNGIWSKETYTNIDMIFFIKPGTDFLKDTFEPLIFPNPHNSEKIGKTPEPFGKMKIHLPPTMLGQSIFGY